MTHHGGERRKSHEIPRDCVEGAWLCTPEVRSGPSGRRLRHSMSCPIHPLEPINLRDYAKGRAFVRGFRGTR